MNTSVVIVGSGIAGLFFAIKLHRLRPDLHITLLTKATLCDGSTQLAQGGVAAVMNNINDSYDLHILDTLKAGAGLCDRDVVEMVVKQAPLRIKELIALGTAFDMNASQQFNLALEGGHSRPRVLHHGDKTGFEIESCLVKITRSIPSINILEHHTVAELCVSETPSGKRCTGVLVLNNRLCEIIRIEASCVILATGGCGQIYQNTTNPAVACGDGYALSARAGALLSNMRYMQFHPTALYTENKGSISFLLTEALRGAGAKILGLDCKPFLHRYDPHAELATRDKVSAAIINHMHKFNLQHVYLDVRHLNPSHLERYFPAVVAHLNYLGYNLQKDLIPIIPSAHYQCGGVKVTSNGESSVRGLFVLGESACTGLHGANRLASNSLLEALVFAHNAVEYIAKKYKAEEYLNTSFYTRTLSPISSHKIALFKGRIKSEMSHGAFNHAYYSQIKLTQTLDMIERWVTNQITLNNCSLELLDLRNMAITASLVVNDCLAENNLISKKMQFT